MLCGAAILSSKQMSLRTAARLTERTMKRRERDGEQGEEGEEAAEEEAGEGAEGTAPSRGIREVRWSVPDGFQVADEPAKLDASLVDNHVYMRWEQFGWQLGKINGIITRSTPRLFKQYKFRLVSADGSKGPAKLSVENYAFGPQARYNSWVILKPIAEG